MELECEGGDPVTLQPTGVKWTTNATYHAECYRQAHAPLCRFCKRQIMDESDQIDVQLEPQGGDTAPYHRECYGKAATAVVDWVRSISPLRIYLRADLEESFRSTFGPPPWTYTTMGEIRRRAKDKGGEYSLAKDDAAVSDTERVVPGDAVIDAIAERCGVTAHLSLETFDKFGRQTLVLAALEDQREEHLREVSGA